MQVQSLKQVQCTDDKPKLCIVHLVLDFATSVTHITQQKAAAFQFPDTNNNNVFRCAHEHVHTT
eukprot:m.35728 g.35728  ORF g.35728 m.35728 type:complete len:64 (+) comp9917_c0_seq1:169-360(+)